jgi:hypothetical protein
VEVTGVMNNQVLFKLVEEVRLQCRFGKFAFDNLRTSLQGMDAEKTFFYVQAFLNHASHVSRWLWPARPESKARGEQLRTELKATDGAFVILSDLRAHREATDEQLEDWIGALENPGYLDFNIMPQGSISAYKQDTFQRSLDPDTYKLLFRGQAWDLRRIVDTLYRIESAAQVWLRTHNPW